MCATEQRIAALPAYVSRCEIPSASSGYYCRTCCRHWSLTNFVTFLNGLHTCWELNATHVTQVEVVMSTCRPFYRSGLLPPPQCEGNNLCEAHRKCHQNRELYQMLHNLVDAQAFTGSENTTTAMSKVSAALMFLPMAKSSSALELYDELRTTNLSDSVVDVPAMDLGAAESLFDRLLRHDVRYVALGGATIVAFLWLYTQSQVLTVLTIMSIGFSLQLAYFVYSWVLRIQFFPITNALAVVVSIGEWHTDY